MAGKKRAVLKAALQGIAPNAVLEGKKRGFGAPVSRRLRGPLSSYLRDVLGGDTMRHSGLFSDVELQRRIKEHTDGSADYGQSLYKMLKFAIWYRRYIA